MSTDVRLSPKSRFRPLAAARRWLFVAAIVCCGGIASTENVQAQGYPSQVTQAGFLHPAPQYGWAPPSGNAISPAQYRELVPASRSGYQRPARRGIRPQGFTPYVRLNYMSGTFDDLGGQVLGGARPETTGVSGGVVTTTTDVDQQYQVLFNGSVVQLPDDSPFTPVAVGESVSLTDYEFSGTNGIEGVLGIPLDDGAVEVSGFAFDQADYTNVFRPRFGDSLTSVIPAIPVTDDGVPTDFLAIPYESLRVSYKIDFYGAGAEYVFPSLTPNLPLTISPTIGAKYLNYREQFGISGTFRDVASITTLDPLDPDSPSTDPDLYTPTIASETRNHIFGPTFGFRADLHSDWVTLTIAPKFGAAVNRAITEVQTSEIFDLTQSDSFEIRESELAPFLELEIGARAHVRPNFDLFVAYKMFAMSRVLRAEEQIVYDVLGTTSNIHPENAESEMVVQSVMVGGEFTFGKPSTGR